MVFVTTQKKEYHVRVPMDSLVIDAKVGIHLYICLLIAA